VVKDTILNTHIFTCTQKISKCVYTVRPTRLSSLNIFVVRNEVDPNCAYHCDAVSAVLSTAEEIDFAGGDRISLDAADGVVLTGSTAGVYESDSHEWITEQAQLVRDLIDREIPTLGICFGHQLVHSALGGTVEHVGMTAGLVEATMVDDPLFEGVGPVVVSLHGDVVTEPADELEVIASAPHAQVFATRHRNAPLWTVQFHPEITAGHRERLVDDFNWQEAEFSFADVTAGRIFQNFVRIVDERTG